MENRNLSYILDVRSDLRNYLFPRGFLVTNDHKIDKSIYPFYNEWNEDAIGEYRLLIHKSQKFVKLSKGDTVFLLIGHAYEPVESQEHREEKLLDNLASLYEKGTNKHIDYFNLWSGSFALFIVDNDQISLYGDPAGMQTVFYGFNNSCLYISSHTNLIGDVCSLTMDEYIERLINYRFYKLFGKTLPGDLSPYTNFKRVIPNHLVRFKANEVEVKRFFPTDKYKLSDLSYEEIIEKSANILKNSMGLIYKKWEKPAISLTGGCDSKTTLSCTNGNYENYSYFSYISQDTESVDGKAAGKICNLINVPHKIYEISSNDEDFEDIELYREILIYNSGSIGNTNSNDVRKRIYFSKVNDFDVEVKSWVSEVVRAYYHKRFSKKRFPKKLTPRYATYIYKVFITNRKLIKDTEKVFAEYLEKYYCDTDFQRIPWTDLLFWEFRVSSWNGLVISGEQQMSYDITIPYNNRELLRLLLSTPLEYRVKDKPHFDIMKQMNPDIYNSGISVVNVKHTNNRAKLERFYLDVLTKLPL